MRRDENEYALYTVSETRQEIPDTVIRMARAARGRLTPDASEIPDEFDAIVDSQVPHPTYTDNEAEDNSEFVERLTDNGAHTGLVAIAPHGGAIERWTDQQAERVASQLAAKGVSCWRCKGWRQDGGAFERWHITSPDIHEASFPLLDSIIHRGFTYAVAVHGFSEDYILVGGGASGATGSDDSHQIVAACPPLLSALRLMAGTKCLSRSTSDALKQEIQIAIQSAIVDNGIEVIVATAADNFNGDNPNNIVNRLAKGSGIQIEQSGAALNNY